MAIAKKINEGNFKPAKGDDRFPVYSKQFNELVDVVLELEAADGVLTPTTVTASGAISGATVTSTGLASMTAGTTVSTNSARYTTEVTLTASEIVGTGAGSLAHASGATLVAAPGAGYALKFINAVLIYDYDTAAYTGGAGDDLTVYIGDSVAVSGAIATADLITKAGDTVINLSSLTTDYVMGVNSTINLQATEVTQPGTAAGVIRAIVTYDVITTNL